MQGSKYRFKFYLNAIHSIDINKKRGQEHPHTWEIVIYTLQLSDMFTMFTEIEKKIEEFLSTFQDKNLNLIEPFNSINPTLENICFFIKDEVERLLIDKGWILLRIEISETPSRTFIIDMSDDKNLSDLQNEKDNNTDYEEISNVVDDNILSSVLSSVETAKNVATKQKDIEQNAQPEPDFYMDNKYSKITEQLNKKYSYEQVKKMLETNRAEIEAGRKRVRIIGIIFGALMILAVAVVCVLKFYLHLF